MDPKSVPKSSKNIITNYGAKRRAYHEQLFVLRVSKFDFERRTPCCCSKIGFARFDNEAVSAQIFQNHEKCDQGRFRRLFPRNGEHAKMKIKWFMLEKWDFGTAKRTHWIFKGSPIYTFKNQSTYNEEKWGRGGCVRKITDFDKKSMRIGDVSGGLNEAKVLYCCSKPEFPHFEKEWENDSKRDVKMIQIVRSHLRMWILMCHAARTPTPPDCVACGLLQLTLFGKLQNVT